MLVGMVDVDKIKEFHDSNFDNLDNKSLQLEKRDNEYTYNYVDRKRGSDFKSYYGDIINNKVVKNIL